jgi:hypothetical protein
MEETADWLAMPASRSYTICFPTTGEGGAGGGAAGSVDALTDSQWARAPVRGLSQRAIGTGLVADPRAVCTLR